MALPTDEEMWDHLNPGREREPEAGPDTKKRALIAGGVVAALALIGGLGLVVFGGDDDSDTMKTPPAPPRELVDPAGKTDWWSSKKNLATEKKDSWQLKAAPTDTTLVGEKERAAGEKIINDNREIFSKIALALPSVKEGFTSDPSEMYLEGLIPNPYYVFQTQEDFAKHLAAVSEAFINPIYGEWGRFQFPETNPKKNFDTSTFDHFLTDGYQNKVLNAKDKSILPVFADWEGNDYGMDNLLPRDAGHRWVGSIQSGTMTVNQDAGTSLHSYTVTYKVKFSTYTQDQDIVTKKGTLKLVLMGNKRSVDSPAEFPLQVNSGKLTIN